MKKEKLIQLENKLAIAKAALGAVPGAGQAAAAGTGAEIVKQAGGLASEKVLTRALMPLVGRGFAGLLGASLVGLLVPSELGDGSISGKITATLKKHFPEADSETLTAKIIMFNKVNGRSALQFPDKRTIHSLAGTDMEDLQRQLEEKAKEIGSQGEPVAESTNSFKYFQKIAREETLKILEEGEFGRGFESIPFSKEEASENEKALYMRAAEFEKGIINYLEEIDRRLLDLQRWRVVAARRLRKQATQALSNVVASDSPDEKLGSK